MKTIWPSAKGGGAVSKVPSFENTNKPDKPKLGWYPDQDSATPINADPDTNPNPKCCYKSS
jgi:hypothetical protein